MPLLDAYGYPATALAEADCHAILVTTEAFQAALTADPAFGRMLLRNLASRVRILVDRIEGLTALTVRARLGTGVLSFLHRVGARLIRDRDAAEDRERWARHLSRSAWPRSPRQIT